MRGSIYYQTALLTKMVFREGAKKTERLNLLHDNYQCVASYKTMETYRRIWNDLAMYCRDVHKKKNMESLEDYHIKHYLQYKLFDCKVERSKQYAEKISSAIGKLEVALNRFCQMTYDDYELYHFPSRHEMLTSFKESTFVYDGYHSRIYQNPLDIINKLEPIHRLAALIQFHSGTRFEGIGKIKKSQLKGKSLDSITQKEIGTILTKEKGGKTDYIKVPFDIYEQLGSHIDSYKVFTVDYQTYNKDIKQACIELKVKHESTHGFRWCFAHNRMKAYQDAGYSYTDSLQEVSYEMKHFRASITEHYLAY
jgi:integrase